MLLYSPLKMLLCLAKAMYWYAYLINLLKAYNFSLLLFVWIYDIQLLIFHYHYSKYGYRIWFLSPAPEGFEPPIITSFPTALNITWNPPRKPNGQLLFYQVSSYNTIACRIYITPKRLHFLTKKKPYLFPITLCVVYFIFPAIFLQKVLNVSWNFAYRFDMV